jgi:hypothetical protein
MVKSGADVNVTNRERVSALMRAATQSDATLVRTLLDAGADLNHRDSRGETALSFAAARGRRENVVLMVESGAAPEAIDRAFVMASKYSESEIARLLLDRGADVKKVGGEALVEAIRQDATGRINDNVKHVIDMVGDVSLADRPGGAQRTWPRQMGMRCSCGCCWRKALTSTACASARAFSMRATGRR